MANIATSGEESDEPPPPEVNDLGENVQDFGGTNSLEDYLDNYLDNHYQTHPSDYRLNHFLELNSGSEEIDTISYTNLPDHPENNYNLTEFYEKDSNNDIPSSTLDYDQFLVQQLLDESVNLEEEIDNYIDEDEDEAVTAQKDYFKELAKSRNRAENKYFQKILGYN